MPTAEEKLRLDIEVSYDDEDLDRLEQGLESVDRSIADTGNGRRDVEVDVDAAVTDAIAELEALNASVKSIEDEITIDADVDDGVGGGVAAPSGGELATSGGRPDLSDRVDAGLESDVLNRMPEAVAEGFRDVADDDVTRTTTVLPNRGAGGTFGVSGGSVFDDERGAELMDLFLGDDANDDPSPFTNLRKEGSDLADQFLESQFTIESFHKIFAAMVPLAVVLMPAAISAVAGLAGAAIAAGVALAGLGGLAIGGMMLTPDGQLDTQPVTERLGKIFDEYVNELEPVMRELAPLGEFAFDQFASMAAPLAEASTRLYALDDTFRSVVSYVTGAVPSLVASGAAFATTLMPQLSAIATFLSNTDFLGFFVAQISRLDLVLGVLGRSLAEIIPALVLLSEGFLITVSALTGLFGMVSLLANAFPRLTTAVGVLTSALLVGLTVTTIYTLALGVTETALWGNVTAFGAAAKGALLAAGGYAKVAASAVLAAIGIEATTLSVIALYSALTLGLVAVGAMSGAFDNLKESIFGASNALKQFNKLKGDSFGGVGPGDIGTPSGGGGYGSGGGGGNSYTTVIDQNGRDSAARQQYASSYERDRAQHVDSIFGG